MSANSLKTNIYLEIGASNFFKDFFKLFNILPFKNLSYLEPLTEIFYYTLLL